MHDHHEQCFGRPLDQSGRWLRIDRSVAQFSVETTVLYKGFKHISHFSFLVVTSTGTRRESRRPFVLCCADADAKHLEPSCAGATHGMSDKAKLKFQ